jgi:predicted RNA binding protein YcfA (HicA-like mRNA interferase family)
MTKLPAARPREIVAALERAGFTVVRTKGSHYHLRRPHHPQLVSVPYHAKDVKKGTLHAIIKAAGLTIEEFLALL